MKKLRSRIETAKARAIEALTLAACVGHYAECGNIEHVSRGQYIAEERQAMKPYYYYYYHMRGTTIPFVPMFEFLPQVAALLDLTPSALFKAAPRG